MFKLIYKRMLNPFYHIDFIYGLTKDKKELDELCSNVRNFTDSVIQKKRDERENNTSHCRYEEFQKVRKTFLDYLLEISEETGHFTNEEIRDEVQAFIIAVNL